MGLRNQNTFYQERYLVITKCISAEQHPR